MSWRVKCPSSKLSQRRLSGVFITVSTVVTSLCRLCLLSLIGQTYLSLCNHHRHSLWGLVVSQSRCQKLFPCFISVVVYVDTATAWSNDSPVFFSVSHLLLFIYLFSFFSNGSSSSLYFLSSILSHLPFSPFYFVDLLVFWRQQVGIDQGDIPDLSQVSVHLTFHFLFLTILTPCSCLLSDLLPFVSGFPSALRVVSLLPQPYLTPTYTSTSPFTHSLSVTLHPLIFISNTHLV